MDNADGAGQGTQPSRKGQMVERAGFFIEHLRQGRKAIADARADVRRDRVPAPVEGDQRVQFECQAVRVEQRVNDIAAVFVGAAGLTGG